jgi:two-component system, sporulation sensor kinase E
VSGVAFLKNEKLMLGQQMNDKELENSEKKFKLIFEKSEDGIILWNDHFQMIDMNSAAEKILGFSKEKLKGHRLFELYFDDEVWRKIYLHFTNVIRNGNHCMLASIENIDGKLKHVEFSSQHGLDEGLNLTIFRDITEKMEIQEQLRKSDTLNVIGELAAGIAHEIRNPMTALKGFVQLLKEGKHENNPMYYQVITTELERIESIINEFLLLAKPQAIKYQMKDVGRIMQETVDLLEAQAHLHNVQIDVHYEKSLPKIYCEPNQLKKVFINLIKNAIEVMPDGGTITIQLGRTETRQIYVSISDEGDGIPQDVINKLGEPFYTTKERGTGLGLMVSFKIIEEHKGTINIDSEMGKGTTFHIHLPYS